MHAARRDSCVNATGTKLFPECAGTGKKICILMWVVFLFQGFFSHQLPSFKGCTSRLWNELWGNPISSNKTTKKSDVKGNDKGSLVIWEQMELGALSPHHSNYWWETPWNTAFPKPRYQQVPSHLFSLRWGLCLLSALDDTHFIKKTYTIDGCFFFARKDRPWQIITSRSYSSHMYDLLFIDL